MQWHCYGCDHWRWPARHYVRCWLFQHLVSMLEPSAWNRVLVSTCLFDMGVHDPLLAFMSKFILFLPKSSAVGPLPIFFWPSIVTSYLGIQNLRSRGSTRRSIQRPLGWQEVPCVHQANVMIARVCILLMVLQAKRIWWCLEQPCNSLLEQHPMFQRFLTMAGVSVRRLSTKLLWFGGPTQKPTWIYSSPFDSQRVHILSYVRW